MAAPETPPSTPEFARMTKQQKLAALLIILGPDSAAQVLKNLDDHELESVTSEMTKLPMIGQELQAEVLEEFSEVALWAGTGILGGMEYTQGALEKAVGLFKATNVITRVAPSRASVGAIQSIAALEARQIFNLIKLEQPQTNALILSYLTPEKASEIIALLRPEVREQVVERLATLAPTPIEVVEKVVEVLNQKLGGSPTRALNQTGGVLAAASVLNALNKNDSKSLLVSLEERNPDLGQAIRQKMFTFEDVAILQAPDLQKILRDVEMRDLAVALKTASETLKGRLLGAISSRAAETVKEEMGFMGPLKLRDIEAAQQRIIEVVRRLETAGEIDLGDGSGKGK